MAEAKTVKCSELSGAIAAFEPTTMAARLIEDGIELYVKNIRLGEEEVRLHVLPR